MDWVSLAAAAQPGCASVFAVWVPDKSDPGACQYVVRKLPRCLRQCHCRRRARSYSKVCLTLSSGVMERNAILWVRSSAPEEVRACRSAEHHYLHFFVVCGDGWVPEQQRPLKRDRSG